MTIDSLINKYEEKIQNIKKQWGEDKFHYHTNEIKAYEEILKDLKRLKNEIHYIDTSKLETDGINHKVIIKTAEERKKDILGE